MPSVINISETMMFDEYEWSAESFYPNELAITIIEHQLNDIDTIAFFHADRMISFVMKPPDPNTEHKSYYFHPSLDTLNHLCKIQTYPIVGRLCQHAVKKYMAHNPPLDISALQYPLLAAIILGK